MKKTKISIYFDSLLISISCSFVLFLCLLNKIKNAKTSFFICIFISILLFFVLFKYLNNKYNLNKIKIIDQKHALCCFEKLLYSSDDFCNNFFNLLLESNSIQNKIYENKNAYFCIDLKTISDENLFHYANNFYLKTNMNKPLIFIINQQDDSFNKLISSSPIKYKLSNFNELYTLMKHKKCYPKELDVKNHHFIKFKNFKEKLKQSLSKKSFFKFFISGLSLIILSIYIPFSIYYLVSGSLLFVFSILCLFSKNNPEPKSNVDLISLTKKD